MHLRSNPTEVDRIVLLEIGSRLFHQFRYDELPVDFIHHKMSLNRDDFDRLFVNKDALFREVLKFDVVNEKDAPWDELNQNDDIRVALRKFLERCKAELMNEAVMGNLVLETATSGANGSFIAGSAIETARNLLSSLLAQRFEKAHKTGQIKNDLSTNERVAVIFSVLGLMKNYTETEFGQTVVSEAIDFAIAGSCS